MTLRAWALPLLLLVPPRPAEDGEGRAFAEIVVARNPVHVHETVPLRLRIGVDAAFFGKHGVHTSLRRLDLPVRVSSPWRGGVAGATLRDDPPPAGDRRTLVVDDEVVAAARVEDVVRDGRTFTVLEIRRRLVAGEPGDVLLAAPAISFTHADRVEEDAFGTGVPVNRREAALTGNPLVLRVLPLPVEGRPPEFSGAVGRFTVDATAGAGDVEAGGSVRVTLRIEGEGNLAAIEPPGLGGWTGFHVLGRLDGGTGPLRTFTWDLVPLDASVTEIPPIPFAFFEPGEAPGYRVLRTRALPLRVRPGPEAPPAAAPPSGGGLLLPAILLACAILGVVAMLRRRTPVTDPAAERVRAAAAAFRTRLAEPGADRAALLAAFLGARLDRPAAAAFDPDLAARLRAAGVPPAPADRAAGAIGRLTAARYGGAPSPRDDDAALLALVEELERPSS